MSESSLPGVYPAKRKDGTIYYRSSITINGKHISLGSFSSADNAHKAYKEAKQIFSDTGFHITSYGKNVTLGFEKWVSLINLRDNKIYIANPIYIRPKMFYYYLSPEEVLKFDADDLFYYSSHKIMKRGGHLFVADYGMQVNLASRYGIKNHGIEGKDYRFLNGDNTDYRYANIEILNTYQGVTILAKGLRNKYKAAINVPGLYVIGYFDSLIQAAIAYNKAADVLRLHGCPKKFSVNYIDSISAKEYADIYSAILIPKKIQDIKF